MKKISVLFDGEHFSEAALKFADTLNVHEPVRLTGLFLPSIDYVDTMIYYGGGWAWPVYPPTIDTDPATIERNVEAFKAYCIKHNIQYRIHDNIKESLKKAIHIESWSGLVAALPNCLHL